MNHTKEPWWKECGTDIVTQDGKFIATTHQPESMVGTELEYENARRIVACVNACAGLDTEFLEKYGLPGLAEKISALIVQRNSLLAAAKRLEKASNSGRYQSGVDALFNLTQVVHQIEEQMK